jgi:toxin YhaV
LSFDERNGWRLFQHPAFQRPFDALTAEVVELKKKLPAGPFEQHPKAKLLKRILALILEEIPRNPNAAEYQLGNTLGPAHRHWRRAKFLKRFRLFFRFDSKSKVIIYAWVNDENSLRKAGSKTDPYKIFYDRLTRGDPLDDWDALSNSVT